MDPKKSKLDARAVGEKIGIDWPSALFDVKDLAKGIEVESEHMDVTGTDPEGTLRARIAAAHLRECPDYYQRLEPVEKACKAAAEKAKKTSASKPSKAIDKFPGLADQILRWMSASDTEYGSAVGAHEHRVSAITHHLRKQNAEYRKADLTDRHVKQVLEDLAKQGRVEARMSVGYVATEGVHSVAGGSRKSKVMMYRIIPEHEHVRDMQGLCHVCGIMMDEEAWEAYVGKTSKNPTRTFRVFSPRRNPTTQFGPALKLTPEIDPPYATEIEIGRKMGKLDERTLRRYPSIMTKLVPWLAKRAQSNKSMSVGDISDAIVDLVGTDSDEATDLIGELVTVGIIFEGDSETKVAGPGVGKQPPFTTADAGSRWALRNVGADPNKAPKILEYLDVMTLDENGEQDYNEFWEWIDEKLFVKGEFRPTEAEWLTDKLRDANVILPGSTHAVMRYDASVSGKTDLDQIRYLRGVLKSAKSAHQGKLVRENINEIARRHRVPESELPPALPPPRPATKTGKRVPKAKQYFTPTRPVQDLIPGDHVLEVLTVPNYPGIVVSLDKSKAGWVTLTVKDGTGTLSKKRMKEGRMVAIEKEGDWDASQGRAKQNPFEPGTLAHTFAEEEKCQCVARAAKENENPVRMLPTEADVLAYLQSSGGAKRRKEILAALKLQYSAMISLMSRLNVLEDRKQIIRHDFKDYRVPSWLSHEEDPYFSTREQAIAESEREGRNIDWDKRIGPVDPNRSMDDEELACRVKYDAEYFQWSESQSEGRKKAKARTTEVKSDPVVEKAIRAKLIDSAKTMLRRREEEKKHDLKRSADMSFFSVSEMRYEILQYREVEDSDFDILNRKLQDSVVRSILEKLVKEGVVERVTGKNDRHEYGWSGPVEAKNPINKGTPALVWKDDFGFVRLTLPDGGILMCDDAADAQRKAEAWFSRHTKGAGEIQWGQGVEKPAKEARNPTGEVFTAEDLFPDAPVTQPRKLDPNDPTQNAVFRGAKRGDIVKCGKHSYVITDASQGDHTVVAERLGPARRKGYILQHGGTAVDKVDVRLWFHSVPTPILESCDWKAVKKTGVHDFDAEQTQHVQTPIEDDHSLWIDRETAKRIGKKLGINWRSKPPFKLEAFIAGINEEIKRRDPTGKIDLPDKLLLEIGHAVGLKLMGK
jgi:hypothetical protein